MPREPWQTGGRVGVAVTVTLLTNPFTALLALLLVNRAWHASARRGTRRTA